MTFRAIRFIFFIFLFLFLPLSLSRAATFSLSPSDGNFSIGSTFSVSILLDTEGESINALEVALSFPPDMLQVVSPSTGRSIIGVWTNTPKFDNKNGILDLQGGIPGGIAVSNGLVSTVTFRVKSVGEGAVKFLDKSKALLNDGLGTDVLRRENNGLYKFKLPPPAGPEVVSDTNPDQATWYPNKTVSLRFVNEPSGVEGYSYILSPDPTTNPDNISEGKKNSISYTNLADGVHYFHVKALRAGVWGGTTHFAIKADTTPPADFKIDIAPSSRTDSRSPVIQYITTDALSGMDHYELKLISLSIGGGSPDVSGFFIEATSPYVPAPLTLGSYDVVVRAYDKSGNFMEVTERLNITTSFFSFISSVGIKIGNWIIPWIWVWGIILLIIILLVYLAYHVKAWKHRVYTAHQEKELPDHIAAQLEELKKYRAKYGAAALVLLLMISSMLFSTPKIHAQTAQIAPPLITNISKNISNEEIFYVGGKTDFAQEEVVIYLQNLKTGETFSQATESDNKGDWFYRHSGFLSPGNYLLWAQGKVGEELSPPGPQVKMVVNRTAVQFGGGRLSYEAIYLFIIIFLVAIVLGLLFYIFFHLYYGRKKHKEFLKDIEEAEESIGRGFAVLRRDIEAELSVLNRVKLTAALSAEEKIKEEQLLSDLDAVQKRIGKEIWELSKEA
ncbi:hypothetical protein HZA26_02730 [Candidatus Nomurabacteria bacterium]|nr:hypothetical protein [Candidatus Nomurabacteria bacterium]